MRINRREFTKTTALAATGFLLGCTVKNRYDIIIRNGLVLDGSGAPGAKSDIGIRGDRIEVIGNLQSSDAEIIIDAGNLAVAPGFIDIHTHTDTQLLVDPRAQSKIMQGVTTEISGNCGSSPFPMNEEDWKEFDKDFYEKYGLHIDWKDIASFLGRLEKQKISINYATFTGHGDLRAYVIGKNDVVPTTSQLQQMQAILEESMAKGSFGLSTGLEYAPGSYATTEELIELCKVVGKRKGIYATHMRNEDDTVEEAIAEALRICREAEVSLQISHFKACNKNNWSKVDHMLEMIHDSAAKGLPVQADRYPYIAYGTGLSAFLPLWSRQGGTDDILMRLNDPEQIHKIGEYAESRGARIGGWDRVVISSCYTQEGKKWEGKSIAEGAQSTGVSDFEFIRQLLLQERNRVGIVGFAMDEEGLIKVLKSPLVMIGSDGSAVSPEGKLGEGKPHPRYYGTFPRVLGKYCREEKCFDLPTAVKKMTSMPAQKMKLKQRGLLQKGYYADLTVFNPATVIDRATFVDPHQFPIGIEYVIVNGKLTVQNGKHTGAVAGAVLRFEG
jgi:N-acyl-D-amino-acid deacylase